MSACFSRERRSGADATDYPHGKASAALEFEEAARIRDQIRAVRRVTEKQFVSNTGDDLDVIGVAFDAGGLRSRAVYSSGQSARQPQLLPESAGRD